LVAIKTQPAARLWSYKIIAKFKVNRLNFSNFAENLK